MIRSHHQRFRGRHAALAMLGLLLSSGGCGDRQTPQLPPERPTTVTIKNLGSGSIYLGDNELSFDVRDAAGNKLSPDTGWGGIPCVRCDEACANTMFGDPMPVWLEVAAGGAISLDWDGRLYRRSTTGCSCDLACFDARTIGPGDYTFVVRYETTLPRAYEPYHSRNRGDGKVRWSGSGLGTASPTLTDEHAVSYGGQRTITLEVTP